MREKNRFPSRTLMTNFAIYVSLVSIEFVRTRVEETKESSRGRLHQGGNVVSKMEKEKRKKRERERGRDYFFNIRDPDGQIREKLRGERMKERRYGERRGRSEINFRKGKQAILVHLNIARSRPLLSREPVLCSPLEYR